MILTTSNPMTIIFPSFTTKYTHTNFNTLESPKPRVRKAKNYLSPLPFTGRTPITFLVAYDGVKVPTQPLGPSTTRSRGDRV